MITDWGLLVEGLLVFVATGLLPWLARRNNDRVLKGLAGVTDMIGTFAGILMITFAFTNPSLGLGVGLILALLLASIEKDNWHDTYWPPEKEG